MKEKFIVPLGVDVPGGWLLFGKHMGLLDESIWFGDLIGSTMFFFFGVILIKIIVHIISPLVT